MGFKDKLLMLPIFGDAIRRLSLLSYARMESLEEMCQKFAQVLDITYEYDNLVEQLKQGDRPEFYHGLNHSLTVFLAAIEGGVVSGVIEDSEMPHLAIAALAHDLNHSRGKETDDTMNIYRAVNAIRSMIEERHGDTVRKNIQTAITATTYPWRKYATVNPMGKILRDADLMAFYLDCPELTKQLFQGLYNETCYRNYKTPEEFVEQQKNFRKAIQWNTNWASIKAVKHNMIARPVYLPHEAVMLR